MTDHFDPFGGGEDQRPFENRMNAWEVFSPEKYALLYPVGEDTMYNSWDPVGDEINGVGIPKGNRNICTV